MKNESDRNKNPLNNALDQAHLLLKQGKSPKFVFDLDSTLFCVSPRTEFILKQFGAEKEVEKNHPQASEILKSISATPEDWGIKSILNRHNVKETLKFFEMARTYWVQHFFSSHHLDKDIPYEGAVEFVNYAHSLGIEIHYLTGRDRERMEVGTIKSLAQHNFPLDTPQCLNMKPDTSIEDTRYKVQVFETWSKEDLESTWFFENEPVIVNQVHRTFPAISIIYMNSVDSGREVVEDPHPKIQFRWDFCQK